MTVQWDLKDVFVAVHCVPSSRALQDMIYLAQEVGALTCRYEFAASGGSFCLPYSPEVHRDLLRLELDKAVFDTETGNSLLLAGHAKSLESRLERPSQETLRRLVKLEPSTLDSLAAVAWAKGILRDSAPEAELSGRIADYLAADQHKVEDYLKLLEQVTSS
jgi:hypothetical protein